MEQFRTRLVNINAISAHLVSLAKLVYKRNAQLTEFAIKKLQRNSLTVNCARVVLIQTTQQLVSVKRVTVQFVLLNNSVQRVEK